MDARINQVAALANMNTYDDAYVKEYVDGAPHIKHASLRKKYGELVVRAFDAARHYADVPRVLDLGAGEGSVTIPFLELGAQVVAVDISESQLKILRGKCEKHGDSLEVRCEDMNNTLQRDHGQFDIVVVNSFLHHVPDYLGMIELIAKCLSPRGVFFSFQDPLRYDTLGPIARQFSRVTYLSWRIFRGDVIGGIGRRLRRAQGKFLPDSKHDNAEYHVVRNGVDQPAIQTLLQNAGFHCDIILYFSTQSRLFQAIGERLPIRNTFAVLAQRNG